MKYAKSWGIGLVGCAVVMSGCSKPEPTKPAAVESSVEASAEHAHGTGPNGGVVFDLGKYHAEFTVDRDKKECYILFVNGDGAKAKPLAVAATDLTVNIKGSTTSEGTVVAPMTIKMSPAEATNGKASKYIGSDPQIGTVADFSGTVFGEIDGKPSQGEFSE